MPRTRSPHCSLRAGQWNPSVAWDLFVRLLLHNPLLVVDCEVMRTTTRATCLAITREGGEGERKGKGKKKVKGLDGTRIVQGREREGNDEVSKQALGRD